MWSPCDVTILLTLRHDVTPTDTCIVAPLKEASTWDSNNLICATSKDSDQPAHTRSLIRAIQVAWILYACYASDWKSFRRLHRLVWVYTNLSSRVPFSPFGLFFFERTSDATIPNVAHIINRPCQGIKTSNHRNMGYGSRRKKPKVVAFQQQRRRPACADAQSDQRLCCPISGKYNW